MRAALRIAMLGNARGVGAAGETRCSGTYEKLLRPNPLRSLLDQRVDLSPLGGGVSLLRDMRPAQLRAHCTFSRSANWTKVVAGSPVSLRIVRLGNAETFIRTTL